MKHRYDDLVERWLRTKSRHQSDSALLKLKLFHISLVVLAWPLFRLSVLTLAVALLALSLFVVVAQRRVPYASLALLTLALLTSNLALSGAWVVFTTADGLAAPVGRMVGGPKLPFNSHKTWTGTITFAVVATLAVFVFLIVVGEYGWRRVMSISLVVAIIGSFVEGFVVLVDDNYSVIVTTGVLLQLLLIP